MEPLKSITSIVAEAQNGQENHLHGGLWARISKLAYETTISGRLA